MLRHIATFVLVVIAGVSGLAAVCHPGVVILGWALGSIQTLLLAIVLNGYHTANLIAADRGEKDE